MLKQIITKAYYGRQYLLSSHCKTIPNRSFSSSASEYDGFTHEKIHNAELETILDNLSARIKGTEDLARDEYIYKSLDRIEILLTS